MQTKLKLDFIAIFFGLKATLDFVWMFVTLWRYYNNFRTRNLKYDENIWEMKDYLGNSINMHWIYDMQDPVKENFEYQ